MKLIRAIKIRINEPKETTERSNRVSQSVFRCKHCGFTLNADLNASRNIVNKYLDSISYPSSAAINQPNSSLLTTNVPLS